MNDKNLDDWFLAQELRRLTLDNCNNLAHSFHDVDDDMPDTHGYSAYVVDGDDVADPNSRTPFEAIDFNKVPKTLVSKKTPEKVVEKPTGWKLRDPDVGVVEFNGNLITFENLESALTKATYLALEEESFNCCASCDSDYEDYLIEMMPGTEYLDEDFGPTYISGTRLILSTQGYLDRHETFSSPDRSRRGRKQDHRCRPTTNLPILASIITH